MIDHDAHAALVGFIRTATMPEAAVVDDHTPGRHLDGEVLDLLARYGRTVPFVRPRHDASAAVVLREIGERPDADAFQRDVRPGQSDRAVVGVEGLRALAR